MGSEMLRLLENRFEGKEQQAREELGKAEERCDWTL